MFRLHCYRQTTDTMIGRYAKLIRMCGVDDLRLVPDNPTLLGSSTWTMINSLSETLPNLPTVVSLRSQTQQRPPARRRRETRRTIAEMDFFLQFVASFLSVPRHEVGPN